MKKDDIIAVVVVVLIIIAASLFSVFVEKEVEDEVLHDLFIFSVSECYTSSPLNESDLNIPRITWLDNSTCKIEVYINENCIISVRGGSYSFTNTTVFLNYTILDHELWQADCWCDYKLTYTLDLYEKDIWKNHQFVVNESRVFVYP